MWTRTIAYGLLGFFGAAAQENETRITGVLNAASLRAGAVAPGSLVRVAGVGLTDAVRVDGLEVAGAVAMERDLVLLIPPELAGRESAVLRIGGAQAELKLAPAAPGIYTADGLGRGRIALFEPARRGESLTFETTGLNLSLPLTVTIAGRRAALLFAGEGRAPGLQTVTVSAPADLEFGGALPLVVENGGARSQLDVLVEVDGPLAPRVATPGRLVALATGGGVRLTWSAGDGPVARYRVERRAGFDERELAVTSALAWTDEVPFAGPPQYRVRAETDWGWSEPTPWVALTAPETPVTAAPAAPSGLRVTQATDRQVRLQWSAGTPSGQRFRVERRMGAGAFAPVAQLPVAPVADWQDTGVAPGAVYGYRVRAEAGEVVSSWSAEAAANTPPASPSLVGTLLSANAARLEWSPAAAGVQRFRLEVRVAGAPEFVEAARYPATTSSARIDALNAGTGYAWRLRAEAETGVSAWSNEVFLLTTQTAPPAPANVRGVPVSPTEIELTWTNMAAEATAVRVEMRAPGGNFVEQPLTPDLTRARVSGLSPGTAYVFRARTESPAGSSVYSNEVTVATLVSTQPRTVYLIHGFGQEPVDLNRLRASLAGPSGVDAARFSFDAGFNWSECASAGCPSNCSVSETATRLAAYILARPLSDVVIVGVGAGGLVARDLIAYNRGGLLTQRRLAGLLTLGSPNLGYPSQPGDAGCPQMLRDLSGDFRARQQTGRTDLSPYLESLFTAWAQRQFPGGSSQWLAIAGRSCGEPVRRGAASGCRDLNPHSDGAVCDDSAIYSIATRQGATPTRVWRDPERQYRGAEGLAPLLCPLDSRALPLSDPPVGSALFAEIRRFINGL